MPKSAADIVAFDFLRLLIIGPAKSGKTTAAVGTAPKPVYVICSDDDASLRPAARVTSEFKWDAVNSTDGPKLLEQMEAAVKEAHRGVKAGEYKTIVWDTVSSFASYLIDAELRASDQGKGPNGREAYPNYERRLMNYIGRLLAIKAHIIVIAHDFPVAAEMDGQIKKKGPGILPAVEGAVRGRIPAKFQDVIYFEKRMHKGKEVREFVTSIAGVFGPGCRNEMGAAAIPADVTKMIERIKANMGKTPAVSPTIEGEEEEEEEGGTEENGEESGEEVTPAAVEASRNIAVAKKTPAPVVAKKTSPPTPAKKSPAPIVAKK